MNIVYIDEFPIVEELSTDSSNQPGRTVFISLLKDIPLAGVLAATGIVALTEMVDRLADDHANARKLAEGLAEMPGLSIDLSQIKSNIVFFELTRADMTAEQLVKMLDDEGARMLPVGVGRIRAVTHYHITAEDIDYTLGVCSKVMRA